MLQHYYKQKLTLTENEWKLYKKRWNIEIVFKKLKNEYNQVTLNLTKFKSEVFIRAKFYSAIILFNFL